MARIALIAPSLAANGITGGQAVLDADAVLERLSQPDVGFDAYPLDVSDDLAGQIDERMTNRVRRKKDDDALLYVSSRVTLVDADVLLQIDPSDPSQADDLASVLDAFCEGAVGSRLLVLEGRHEGDALRAAEMAGRVRELAKARGVELIVAISRRSASEEATSTTPSPFTMALLRAIDDAGEEGLFAEDVYAAARASGPILGASSYLEAELGFALVRPVGESDDNEPSASEGDGSAEVGHEEADTCSLESNDPDPTTDGRPEEGGNPGDNDARPVAHIEPRSLDASRDETDLAPTLASSVVPDETSGPLVADDIEVDVDVSPGDSAPTPSSATSSSPTSEVVLPTGAAPTSEIVFPVVASSTVSSGMLSIAAAEEEAEAGRLEEALTLLKRALALVATEFGDPAEANTARARIHARIGQIRVAQRKAREAAASFEKALTLDPSGPHAAGALRELVSIYAADRDTRLLLDAQSRLVEQLDAGTSGAETWAWLGSLWLEQLHDPTRARSAFESARRLHPANEPVLAALHRMANDEGRTADAIELEAALARLGKTPADRASALLGLGRRLLGQPTTEGVASSLLEEALEAAPGLLEPLALLSEHLADRQEWSELEGLYRRTLVRIERIDDDALRRAVAVDLQRRLALLLRDHLEDLDGASRSVEDALATRVADPTLRRLAAELAQERGDLERRVVHLEALVALDARDASTHEALFEMLMRSDQVERAVDVAEALTWMGGSSERVRLVFESAARGSMSRPARVFARGDWSVARSHVEPWREAENAEIEAVAELMRSASRAICGALTEQAIAKAKLPTVDESLRVDTDTSTVSAVRAIAWIARCLDVELPTVYADESSPQPLRALPRAIPTTIVGSSALRGRSLAELSFLCGHHLVYELPEHRPVRLASSLEELAVCVLATMRIVRPSLAVPDHLSSAIRSLSAQVDGRLDAESRRALEHAAQRFDRSAGRVDLGSYVDAVERAALRVGAVLAGRLDVAMATLGSLPEHSLSKGHRERILLASMSRGLARTLRDALGIDHGA
jgi:tetratricopeptide (TPR) repeat protein